MLLVFVATHVYASFINREAELRNARREAADAYLIVTGKTPIADQLIQSISLKDAGRMQELEAMMALEVIRLSSVEMSLATNSIVAGLSTNNIMECVATCYENNDDWRVKGKCVEVLVEFDIKTAKNMADEIMVNSKADFFTKLQLVHRFATHGIILDNSVIQDGLASADIRIQRYAISTTNAIEKIKTKKSILSAEELVKPQEKTMKAAEPAAATEAVATMQLTVGEKTVFQSERDKNQYKKFKLVLDENEEEMFETVE